MRMISSTGWFLNDCMKELQRPADYLFKDWVDKYIRYNNEVSKTPLALGFFFCSTHYGSYKVGTRSPSLHSSLHEGFEEVLLEHRDSIDSLSTVKHFIINALNRTVVTSDLEKILPAGLHQFIEAYSTEAFGSLQEYPRDALKSFIEAKQPAIDKINEVLALNLLIG